MLLVLGVLRHRGRPRGNATGSPPARWSSPSSASSRSRRPTPSWSAVAAEDVLARSGRARRSRSACTSLGVEAATPERVSWCAAGTSRSRRPAGGPARWTPRRTASSAPCCRSWRAPPTARRSTADAAFSATHDDVTGLPNRVLVLDRIAAQLADPVRGRTALVLCGLTRYEEHLAVAGVDGADRLARRVAAALAPPASSPDALGRIAATDLRRGLPAGRGRPDRRPDPPRAGPGRAAARRPRHHHAGRVGPRAPRSPAPARLRLGPLRDAMAALRRSSAGSRRARGVRRRARRAAARARRARAGPRRRRRPRRDRRALPTHRRRRNPQGHRLRGPRPVAPRVVARAARRVGAGRGVARPHRRDRRAGAAHRGARPADARREGDRQRVPAAARE